MERWKDREANCELGGNADREMDKGMEGLTDSVVRDLLNCIQDILIRTGWH